MSSRRTRRGTLLEGEFQGENLQQNHSIKGNKLSPKDSSLSQKCTHNMEKNSAVCNKPKQDFIESQLPIEFSSPGNSPHSKRNLWDCLQKGARKKDLPSSDILCNDSISTKVLSETVSFSNASVLQDTSSKCRKPEILVSLLENEAYPCVKLKAKCNEKPRSGDENRSIMSHRSKCRQITKLRDGDSYPTSTAAKQVCFFPYCEHHSKENFKPPDFLPISEVPEESFLVSLSKDKNKELNMVTTSSGTLRVGPGCNMRRFLTSGSSGKYPHAEFSCGDNGDTELRADIKENRKLSSLLPDLTRNSLPATSTSQTSQCISNKSGFINECDFLNDTTLPNENIFETDKSLLAQELEKIKAEMEEKTDKKSTNCCTAQSPGDFLLEKKHGNSTCIAPSEDYVSSQPHSPDIFSLLENSPCDKNMKAVVTSTVSSLEAISVEESSIKQSREPVSFLRSKTPLPRLPSLSTLEPSVSRLDSSITLKRSERIRCKSKLPMEAKVELEKYVLPPVKVPKTKFKCSERLVPNIKQSIKKKCLKKMTTLNNKKKKGLTVKISKKKKCQMTRKVMDGIVQSIEETVLRASQDKGFEKIKKCTEMAAERTGGQSNFDADLSVDSSFCNRTSSSGLSFVDEQEINTDVLQSKPNLFSASKKKLSRLHKNKQRANKSKFYAQSSSFNKKTTSKHKCNKAEIKQKTTVIESNVSESHTAMLNKDYVPESLVCKLDPSSTSSAITAKRSRKKSKKAKEAFDNFGLTVFWEEDEPTVKSKSKKRINTNDSECCSGSNKRPRKNCQLVELMSDPVLEQHAYILWASENRSQVEMQHPETSAYEVDAILSSRWSDVQDTMKGRFFLRAREALSDDDRRSLQACSVLDYDIVRLSEKPDDQDPQFIEFIGLPVDKQRDMLRRWLKFFQKVLPKKEYIEFIVTFKHACGETDSLHSEPGKPVKRPRMSCLDPAHYRLLFDLIRLTKPRIIEVCKDRKGREKKIVSQTYSMIVHKLVLGEPWPEINVNTCQSQSLTEVLLDLNIDCSLSPLDDRTSSMVSLPFRGISKNKKVRDTFVDTFITDSEKGCKIQDTTSALFDPDSCAWNNTQNLEDIAFNIDVSCDLLLDESDYSCLNTDIAENLLSGLFELNDLPVIDQCMLDEVFLAPPQKETRCMQHHWGGGGQGGGSAGAALSFSSHSLSVTESSIFPKMNIHHPSTLPSLPCHHHHQMLPPSSSAILAGRQYFAHDMTDMAPATPAPQPLCSFRKDSLMDMHSYSINMDENSDRNGVGNLTSLCMNRVGPPNMPSKCMKAYPKTLLGPSGKLSIQTVPNTAHKSSTFHSIGPHPSYCSQQQEHVMSSHILTGSSSVGLKSGKSRSHHFVPAKFTPQAYSVKASNLTNPPSSYSRYYPHHSGLGPSSPLITSLSPLRNVKYQGQVSTKLYSSSPCAMMPYRPRLQLTESPNIGTTSLCHRRSTHTMPISTTLNSFATARGQSGNIQQIKVCLPTQALKIPIAKLRGGKKSTYIKGKLKNVGLPSSGPETNGNISCVTQKGCKTSGVLAKVLSLQVKNETGCTGADYRSSMITEASYTSPKFSSTTSTFIGTMRPMSSQLECCSSEKNGCRNSKKVQLVSVDSRTGYSRPLGSTHTAVIVSPVSVHKHNSGRQFLYTSASNAMETFRLAAPVTSNTTVVTTAFNSNSTENLPSLHLNHSFQNSRYLPKINQSETKFQYSQLPSVSIAKERGPWMKPSPLPVQEDEDESGISQFVVVGTRTTCLPIPKKRNETFGLMGNTADSRIPAAQFGKENIQEFRQKSDNVGDKLCVTSLSNSSFTSSIHDDWDLKSVPSIENIDESMSQGTFCPQESFSAVTKVEEKPHNNFIGECQENKNVTNCQVDSHLESIDVESRNIINKTLHVADETKNDHKTIGGSLENLNSYEKDQGKKSSESGIVDFDCSVATSNSKKVCEDEPLLGVSTVLPRPAKDLVLE